MLAQSLTHPAPISSFPVIPTGIARHFLARGFYAPGDVVEGSWLDLKFAMFTGTTTLLAPFI